VASGETPLLPPPDAGTKVAIAAAQSALEPVVYQATLVEALEMT